jgi:hypothetical protein
MPSEVKRRPFIYSGGGIEEFAEMAGFQHRE